MQFKRAIQTLVNLRGSESFLKATAPSALAAALCLLGAVPLGAQGIPSAADAPREGEEIKGDTGVAEIREVERGFYFGVDTGQNYFLNFTWLTDDLGVEIPFVKFVRYHETCRQSLQPPATSGTPFEQLQQVNLAVNQVGRRCLQPGQRIGLRSGYDVLNNFNIEATMVANFNREPPNPTTLQSGNVTGDFTHIVPGIAARFAFVTTERLFVYARVGFGASFWFPGQNTPGSITGFVVDDFAMGLSHDFSVGLEYYTQLRHLSVGVELTSRAHALPFAFGFELQPTLKYTF